MNSVSFDDLDLGVQSYLLKKYGLLRGQLVDAPDGPRYCYGGSCGCIPHRGGGRMGRECPQERVVNLTQSIYYVSCNGLTFNEWKQGDPVEMMIRDGHIISVTYQ